MTLDVRINGHSLRDVLAAAPKISDQMNAVCTTLDLAVKSEAGLGSVIGKTVELFYNGKRDFYGTIEKRGINSAGNVTYKAYDGLFRMSKITDDYYFKNMTATQAIKTLAAAAKVPVAALANTGAVFKALYYPGANNNKITTDLLVRTRNANGRKFWLRFDPVKAGLYLYERTVPKTMWSFLAGVNLTDASYEESIEEIFTAVKLVNRESGKVVKKTNPAHVTAYGFRQHFAEVNKDAVKVMDKTAANLLKDLDRVRVAMNIAGINPDGTMDRLYSGDTIYVEERVTKIVGAYNITEINHTYVSDDLVQIDARVSHNPEIPALQYEDATEKPDFLKTAAEKKAEEAAKQKAKPKAKKKEKAKPTPAKPTTVRR